MHTFEGSEEQRTIFAGLAALTVEQRDRIIEATKFETGPYYYGDDCGCLIGTAYGMDGRGVIFRKYPNARMWRSMSNTPDVVVAAVAFEDACEDYGPETVIASCKAECARLNGSDPAAIRALVPVPRAEGVV